MDSSYNSTQQICCHNNIMQKYQQTIVNIKLGAQTNVYFLTVHLPDNHHDYQISECLTIMSELQGSVKSL